MFSRMTAIVAEACLIVLVQHYRNFRYFCTLAGNVKGGCLLAQHSGREDLRCRSSLSLELHQGKGRLWLPRALKVQYKCTNKMAPYFFFFSTSKLQGEGGARHVGLLITFFFVTLKWNARFSFPLTPSFLSPSPSCSRLPVKVERRRDSATSHAC